MRTLSLILSVSLLLVACKKDDKDGIPISHFPDIEMTQGYDTLYIPIEAAIDSSMALSVSGLPQNMTAHIIAPDSSTERYRIRFIAHYTLFDFGEPNVTPGKILDTGIYKVNLQISRMDKTKQLPFSIHIKPHYVLSLAGEYLQNSECHLGSVVNQPVKVEIQNNLGDSSWLIGFQNLIFYPGHPDTLDACRFYNNTFQPQFNQSRTGVYYPFEGRYIDGQFELKLFSCSIRLTKKQ